MADLLDTVPSALLLISVTALAVAGGIGLLLLVRRRWPPETLESHNDVAGFVFAVMGVVYAVLLAFVVLGVWDQYQEARRNADEEAARLLVAFHVADHVPGGLSVQQAIRRYTELVVADDWPAARQGQLSATASSALEAVIDAVGAVTSSPETTPWIAELLRVLDDAAIDRAQRLDDARAALPSVLWIGVIFGGAVTIAYSALYGVRNLAGHLAMTAALAGIIGLTVAVVLVLDAPYRADSAIQPEAFELALSRMLP